MVVPNRLLYSDGVGARIKQQLFADCNVHTIVRLPPGVFAPYTDLTTNLIFFEKTGRTRETWFYEISPPADRKKYSKTKPMHHEEFAECASWWGGGSREGRVENHHAWRVSIGDIEASGFNLDRKNPNGPEELSHHHPQELAEQLSTKTARIATLVEETYGPGMIEGALDVTPEVAQRVKELHWFASAEAFATLYPALVDQLLRRYSNASEPLSSLVDLVSDVVQPGEDPEPAAVFIGLQHLERHTGRVLGSLPVDTGDGPKQRFRPGDVLYPRLRPYLNKAWAADRNGLCSVDQYVLRPRNGVSPEGLAHAMRGATFLSKAVAFTSSLQLPRIRKKDLMSIEVPVIEASRQMDVVGELEATRERITQLMDLCGERAAWAEALIASVREHAVSG